MSPRTKPIENRRTEGTENKCELNKQIFINISPIKAVKGLRGGRFSGSGAKTCLSKVTETGCICLSPK